MLRDVIIIGGGMSGLTAAINLELNNVDYLLIEQEKELAKKIYATGNGRCNFTNSYYDENSYRGDNSLADSIVARYDYKSFEKFIISLGILTKDKNGYYYPRNNQAKTIAHGLINAVKPEHILTDRIVKSIVPIEEGYRVITSYKDFEAKNILITTGGKSGVFFKNNSEAGYDVIRDLGIKVTELYPALIELKLTKKNAFASLKGLRIDGCISVYADDNQVSPTYSGELQFNADSISGIPTFQVSRYAYANTDKQLYVCIDFLPEYTLDELLKLYEDSGKGFAEGLLPAQLIEFLSGEITNSDILKSDECDIKALLTLAKNYKIYVSPALDYKKAQVTAGGVPENEINTYTLESLGHKNIYFAGEVLNVDGNCGGYNLQFAYSSAMVAVNAILES